MYHSDGFTENLEEQELVDAYKVNHEPRVEIGSYSSLPPY